jgi:hypothetical protein
MTTTPFPAPTAEVVRMSGSSAIRFRGIHPDLKSKILAAIVVHIQTHGHRHWRLLQERPEFAHVIGKASGPSGVRKLRRWVKSVSTATPADRTRPHENREAADDALRSAIVGAREAAQKNLPTAPPPSYLMAGGAQATKNIDFLAGVGLLWEDALRLRDHGLKADPNSNDGTSIEDPKVFSGSIGRRLEILESALGITRQVWDLDHQRQLYEAITEIIVEELASVPDIQRRVIIKLTELNNRRGMTIHAEVR